MEIWSLKKDNKNRYWEKKELVSFPSETPLLTLIFDYMTNNKPQTYCYLVFTKKEEEFLLEKVKIFFPESDVVCHDFLNMLMSESRLYATYVSGNPNQPITDCVPESLKLAIALSNGR